MLERTLVFVDTSYLLASFYNSWETGARAQLEIDLPEVVGVLGGMIENQLHQPIHRQLWYDGIPESGPHRYQRALRSCDGVQLRAGQLIAWGERRTQKAVDTRLVADMVVAAVNRQYTDIVLVSDNAGQVESYIDDPENNPSYYATYIWSGPEGAFSVVDSYEQNDQRLLNLYTLGSTEGMASYNVILDQLIQENFTKMITGDVSLDAFDDFAAQWISLGGEQITQEVNQAIGR